MRSVGNPGLIMCSLTPFGQTGPWRDYRARPLHLAAGGQMACCGYDEKTTRRATIAPGGGNAWHMGGHYAYMAIMAALFSARDGQRAVHRRLVHEACALTTESAIPNYIYRGETLRRHTGRHHSPGPGATHAVSRQGRPVCVNALVSGRLNPGYIEGAGRLPRLSTAWPPISTIRNTRTRR